MRFRDRLAPLMDRTILLSIIAVWLAAAAFYWFSFRPSQIRKTCDKVAVQAAARYDKSSQAYDFYYQKCMNKNGLAK